MPGVYFRITGVNQSQFDFTRLVTGRMLSIVNDADFQDRVSKASYSGRRFRLDGTPAKFISADNARILNQILTGKEWGAPGNGNIDLKLRLGPTNPGAIGYVSPPDPLITTNPSWFNKRMAKNDSLSVATHWMHEWMHVSGFRHASSNPDRDDVPYTIGEIVVEIGKKIARSMNEETSLIDIMGLAYQEAFIEQASDVADDEDITGPINTFTNASF